MSTPAIASDISTLLKHKTVDVKAWFESGTRQITGLMVRKRPMTAESFEFISATKDKEPDRARFNFIIQYGEKRFNAVFEMAFYSMRWASADTINFPGLLFNVIGESGEPVQIEYFTLKYTPTLDQMEPEVWCKAWLQKVLKSPNIKAIFAHTAPLNSEEDE